MNGPDGVRIRITKQEFPYDIGILENIYQAMGTTFLLWLWPFALTPSNESGLSFKTNGFECKSPIPKREPLLMCTDSSTSWPPPDPDRMHKKKIDFSPDPSLGSSDHNYIQAFRERQRQDFTRLQQSPTFPLRQRRLQTDFQGMESPSSLTDEDSPILTDTGSDRLAWRDSEGERLEDFGVDEEVDLYDEDDVPLAELIRRRNAGKKTEKRR